MVIKTGKLKTKNLKTIITVGCSMLYTYSSRLPFALFNPLLSHQRHLLMHHI